MKLETIAEARHNIVSVSTLHNGTCHLFAHTFAQFGIEVRFADYRDPDSFAVLIDARTWVIIANPWATPPTSGAWPSSRPRPAYRPTWCGSRSVSSTSTNSSPT